MNFRIGVFESSVNEEKKRCLHFMQEKNREPFVVMLFIFYTDAAAVHASL